MRTSRKEASALSIYRNNEEVMINWSCPPYARLSAAWPLPSTMCRVEPAPMIVWRVGINSFVQCRFYENLHRYRQDCRVAANSRYCFYSQAKNQVFRPAGATRCTDSSQTGQNRRAHGSTWLCKISPQSSKGVGMRPPKYQKFPLFGKELPRRGDSLDRFRKLLGGFYTPNYSTLVFQISCDSHHRLRSYCWETARR